MLILYFDNLSHDILLGIVYARKKKKVSHTILVTAILLYSPEGKPYVGMVTTGMASDTHFRFFWWIFFGMIEDRLPEWCQTLIPASFIEFSSVRSRILVNDERPLLLYDQ